MTLPDAFSLTRWFIAPTVQSQANPTLTPDWIGATMTYWDAASYANLVTVGPITYANLPVVSPSGLTAGSVLLARVAGGYIIMGMLGSARTSALLDPIRYRRLKTDIILPNTTFIDAGLLSFPLKADTEYALQGCLFYTSTTSNDIKFAWAGPPSMGVQWGMFGLNNATTFSIIPSVVTGYGDGNPQTIQGAGAIVECQPGGWFNTTDVPGILQLRVALDSGTTAGTLHKGSWLQLAELGSGTGTTTFIKQYAATASRSYGDSGNPIGSPDQDNNVYHGNFPDRTFGNERSLIVFPGATIRSDLAGASVLSATLNLYCFKAEETHGSLVEPRTEPNTSVPATYNPGGSNPGASLHDAWPVPGWLGAECLYAGGASSLLNGILAGGNSVGLPPTLFGLAATGFRGYGFSAAYRPYLQVTYAL